MSRAVLILGREDVNQRAMHWIRKAPAGTRLTFQEPKRSLDQNARLWAVLTDFASQATHNGRKYTPDQWKAIFMQAYGKEVEFLPTLDGTSFFPVGMRTSELSVKEMVELQDFIEAEGAQRGVVFHVKEIAA